jgi:Neuraminidase (sialidase)
MFKVGQNKNCRSRFLFRITTSRKWITQFSCGQYFQHVDMQALTIFVEYNSGVLLRPIVHILGEVYK